MRILSVREEGMVQLDVSFAVNSPPLPKDSVLSSDTEMVTLTEARERGDRWKAALEVRLQNVSTFYKRLGTNAPGD
jgi:hypothetical protein